jgi:hypothetical protein
MASQQDLQDSQAAIPAVNSFEHTLFVRLDNCQREQPIDSTVRPSFEPEPERGPDFTPFCVPEREPQVRQLPPTRLLLFQQFLPESLVEDWVGYTNNSPRPGPEGPKQQHSRENSWTDTSLGEVFIWVAILIYMGLHKEKRARDHWRTSTADSMVPTHPILQYMSFNRFFLLQRHIRLTDTNSISCGLPTPFAQANEWAEHIQQTSVALCQLGTCLAIDECIVGYTGRSKQTVTVPNKPTPTGFKVWVVGQAGYFIRWLWHQPSNALGPAVGKKRKRATGTAESSISLNPTQSVVIALVKQLPEQTYHIFFDNLFSSPNLLKALRQLGIGATGTARVNCGFYQPFVEAKKADTRGNCWPWGMLKTAPTPDGQVRVIRDRLTSNSLTNLSSSSPRLTNSHGRITLLCFSSQQSIQARNLKSEFGAGRQQHSLEHAQYSKNLVPSLYYVFLCRLLLQSTTIKWVVLILVTS